MSTLRIAVVAGARTPFTKAGSVQKRVPAYELGRVALREAMERAGVAPEDLDEVIFGNIAQPADATNIARVVALRAGCPLSTSAYTVNRNCGSALQAIADAMLRIETGRAQLIAAGGTESMSLIPLLFPESMKGKLERVMRARSLPARLGAFAGFRAADFKPILGLMVGLTDNFCGLNMGETAEVLAREFHLSREEQDAFALRSHELASAAQKEGRLAPEITPVPLPPDYRKFAAEDVGLRHEQSMAALAKLPPAFDRRYGTVTAGNASQITDGAAALVLASERAVRERGLPVLGWVRSVEFAALAPARMGLGPAFATARALDRAGVDMRRIGLVEMNEAFAADRARQLEGVRIRCVRARRTRPVPRDRGHRSRPAQRERRSDRARPSRGRDRRAARPDGAPRDAPSRRGVGPRHPLHRRRPGRRCPHWSAHDRSARAVRCASADPARFRAPGGGTACLRCTTARRRGRHRLDSLRLARREDQQRSTRR